MKFLQAIYYKGDGTKNEKEKEKGARRKLEWANDRRLFRVTGNRKPIANVCNKLHYRGLSGVKMVSIGFCNYPNADEVAQKELLGNGRDRHGCKGHVQKVHVPYLRLPEFLCQRMHGKGQDDGDARA